MCYFIAINVLENVLLSVFIIVDVAEGEQRQRLNGALINSILRLSIYCVSFWKSMEKSWHHFQPIPGQEVRTVRQFYSPL